MSDLWLAFHSLRRSPGFTVVAILTLALGIGATTSAFGLMNAVLLRPLPYPESDRLDRIFRQTPQNSRGAISTADYLDFRQQMGGYGEVAAYGVTDMNMSEPDRPADLLVGARVSSNFFSVLGATLEAGRSFRPEEEVLGRHRVVIIGHRYWLTRFSGDADVVGRTVRIDGEPHEIVGVLPRALNDWRHLGPFDVFRPLGLSAKETADRRTTWLRMVGRRAAGVDRKQAGQFIAGAGARLAAEFPAENAGSNWRSMAMIDAVAPASAQGIFFMLVGLSTFVLLIACSNLANLLLVRTVARAREIAVRRALGASKMRLLRPMLIESLLLASAGGVLAVQVAIWCQRWLNDFARTSGADPETFALDWRMLLWTFGAALTTVLVFGLAPALFALRLDLNGVLKNGGRGSTAGAGYQRFRKVLIAGQFALAMVLLGGVAIFVRGLEDWNNRSFGWKADRVVTGTMLLPSDKYTNPQEIAEFHRLTLEKVGALPGVTSASLSWSMPFFSLAETRKYVVQGQPTPERGREPVAATNGVSPDYFATLGTRLISGRVFSTTDTLTSPKVFIINRAMARALFGNETPLGRRIARAGGEGSEWGEIVGMASDTEAATSDRLAVTYQVYQPLAQEPRGSGELAVRTNGTAPEALVENIRTAMMALDPDLPVRQLQPAMVTVARAQNYQWIIGRILSLLSVLGLGLASLGIYGVIARSTAQRKGEFGIRLALGAQRAEITRLVLGSGARLALVGSALGALGAFGLTRLISAAFPGLPMSSLSVLAVATLVLMAIAQAACYLPARAAARTSLLSSLRSD